MDTPRPPRQTMAATDSSERGMSLTQQPTPTPLDPKSKRGRGERLGIMVAAVITALCIAGIAFIVTNNDKTPAQPQTGPPAPAPSTAAPSVQPAPPTAADLAAAAAQERYREYLRVRDEVGQSGFTSPIPYDAVAVPPERVDRRIETVNSAQEGLRAIGSLKLASLTTTSVDLAAVPGSYPTVTLQACLDVSGIDVVDRSGKSVVLSERVERSKSTVTMNRYEPGTAGAEAGGWFVYDATSKGEAC